MDFKFYYDELCAKMQNILQHMHEKSEKIFSLWQISVDESEMH